MGVMVAGAVVAMSALNNSLDDPEDAHARHQEDGARDVLDALLGLPPQNTSVHYSHRLEEVMVQRLAGDERALAQLLRQYESAEHRLELQVGARNYPVVGPSQTSAGAVPTGDSAFWHTRMGSMLMAPTVSHHEPGMPIQFDLLPVWMDRVATQPGHPALIDASFSPSGGGLWNHSSTVHYRLPVDGGGHPLQVTPHTPGGQPGHVFSEGSVVNGSDYDWDIRFKLEPVEAGQEGVWLDPGDRFHVITSASWHAPVLLDEDWALVSAAEDPSAMVEYTGRPIRDGGETWLNLTVNRPVGDGLAHHEVLRLESGSSSGAQIRVVLTPGSVDEALPVMVHPSLASPLSVSSSSPLELTVTNPGDASLSLESFDVRFPSMAHQFKQQPGSWSLSYEGADAVFSYTGSAVTISAGGAQTLSLPLKVEKAEGDNVRGGLPPLLEYLGPGHMDPPVRDGPLSSGSGDDSKRAFSFAHGPTGGQTAWLDGADLGDGTHSVRVGGQGTMPPGRGAFQWSNDPSDGLLPELQKARHSMAMQVSPGAVAPGEEVTVTLDSGRLVAFLEDPQWSGALVDDSVTITLRAGDLIGHLTGQSDVVETAQFTPGEFDTLEPWVLSFPNSALLGPVVVSLEVDVETVQHGAVSLNFLGHTVRSDAGDQVVPMFAYAHLQFWSEAVSRD